MSIKVLVISDYRQFHSLRPEAEIFIGLAKTGIDIHVMTYGECEYAEIFKKEGIRVIDFHPEKKFNRAEISLIRNELIIGKYDILYLFNNYAIINAIQAAKKLKVKVLLYRGYAGNISWYDPTSYTKFLHPRVDKIICNSIGVEEYIHRQLLFKKSKTITINKGHKLDWYNDVIPVNLRAKYKLPDDAFLLINVAINRRMKGIPYLIEAMNNIPEDLPIHLFLVGKNMDDKANLKAIKKLTNKNRIHLIGFKKDSLNYVAGCDTFVLPSIKGESITRSVLEAMSMAKPCIISDIRGNYELVVNNESGLIVPSKNSKELGIAILNLFNKSDLRMKLGQNAKLRIQEQLNTKQTVKKTGELFKNILK